MTGASGKISQVDFLDWVSSFEWVTDTPPPEPQQEAPPASPPAEPAVVKVKTLPRPPPAPLVPSPNWNDQYWSFLASTELSVSAKGLYVAQLVKEFRLAAEALVTQLLDTPDVGFKAALESQSITTDTGDRATWFGYNGGATPGYELYVANGLCCFLWRAPTAEVWKTLGDDLRASRAVAHALELLPSAVSETLSIPLQCLVDYRGARAWIVGDLTAPEVAPLPPFGPVPVAFAAPTMAVLRHLNACPSAAEAQDLASALPPATQLLVVARQRFVWLRLRHLCGTDKALRQLRPEYLKQFPTAPLADTAAASQHLLTSVVPAAVARLETNEYFHVVDAGALTKLLHGDGINMRLLGRLYELAGLQHVRRLLLTEMVARTAKVLLRSMLRGAAQPKAVVLDLVNLVCGTSSDSVAFFAAELFPTLGAKFGLATAPAHGDLHLPQVFHALCFHVSATLSLHHVAVVSDTPGPFRAHHLLALTPTTTLLAPTTATALALLETTDALVAEGRLAEAVTNVKLGLAVEQANPTDGCRVQWCHLLACAAELSVQLADRAGAETFAQLALEDGPRWHASLAKAHVVATKLAHLKGDEQSIGAHLGRAVAAATWHLGAHHVYLFDVYMTGVDVWLDRAEWYPALAALDPCLGVVKESYGRKSIPFAEVRTKQAGILAHVGSHEEALSLYEDSLEIYELAPFRHLVGCRADCCSAIAQLLLVMQAAQPAYTTALKAHGLRQDAGDDLLASFVLLGDCATALDDPVRAIEYYTSAWRWIKAQPDVHDGAVATVQHVTRRLLQLQQTLLSPEAQQVLHKVRQHAAPASDDTLAYVAGELFGTEPGDYLQSVLEAAMDERPPPGYEIHPPLAQLRAMLELQEHDEV
ncbi:hypothetical protein ACHHYP_04420 [Achlya hypogyna]|uniref:Clu domain-containing protein n=1 Tax=Achlya hypogyna TaxID=1202772 RepID=A0A1V9ZP82_ACHHY|nr:hypothetical protein ACHHYP_04420 [Achlya hypogyna]